MQLLKLFGKEAQVQNVVHPLAPPEGADPFLKSSDKIETRLLNEKKRGLQLEKSPNESNLWARFKAIKRAYYALIFLLIWSLFCGLISLSLPSSHGKINMEACYETPSWSYWLGRDGTGRSYLLRLCRAYLISISAACLGAFISLFFGCLIGVYSAMVGGLTDSIVFRIAETMNSFDQFLLVIVISNSLSLNLWQFNAIYCVIYCANQANSIRSFTLDILGRPYIENAQLLGMSKWQLAQRHIYPHLIPTITTIFLKRLLFLFKREAFFIEMGVRIDSKGDFFGKLIQMAYSSEVRYFVTWISWVPIGIYTLVNVGLNFITDGYKEAKDPKLGITG